MNNPMEPDSWFTWFRESVLSRIAISKPLLAPALTALACTSLLAAPAVNLDQGRNGRASTPISPVEWVNGNLNSSQSHYLEGYAIPYRLIMTDLPTDGTEIVLTLGYDVTHGGKHAIDFLTSYQCMDDPLHDTYFSHGEETVQPLDGITLIGDDATGLDDSVQDTVAILTPLGTGTVSYAEFEPADGFSDNSCDKFVTIYGAEFSSDSGPEFAYTDNDGNPQEGDLTADQSEQLFTVRFKASSPTAVLAWGGHIASRNDWGSDPETEEPYSAGALSGSPYHMRVIDWSLGNLGNQDRSLSAGAVVALEECDLFGPDIVCHDESPYEFTVVTDATTFSWQLIAGPEPAYNDAIISGTNTKTVAVETPGPNTGFFTLEVTVDAGLDTENICTKVIEVRANPECSITGTDGPVCPGTTNLQYSAPADMDEYLWSIEGDAVIVGAADQATVSVDADNACDGSFTLSLTIYDGPCMSVCEKTVVVADTTAPTIETCPGSLVLECPASIDPADTGMPVVSDDCDAQPSVDYQDVDGRSDCGLGVITRTWTVMDACGNTSQCVQVIEIVDTTDPVLSDKPASATVECSAVPSVPTISATDGCDQELSVIFDEVDLRNPDCGTGTITRTWTVSDCAGNSDSHTQTLTVVDTTAPALSAKPADATVECSAIPAVPVVTATDLCSVNLIVSFEEVDLRTNECNTGSITRTWTVSDCSGNTDSHTQTLTVVDTTAPDITCPADVDVECGDPTGPGMTGYATAIDNCDDTVDISYVDVRNVDGCGGSITRTWTAVDCTGNSSSCDQIITLVDTTDPVLTVPDDVDIECDVPNPESVDTGTATAVDNCDDNVDIGFVDVVETDECGYETTTRTWTATDCAGNSVSADQIIAIVDTTPPVITAPADQIYLCDECPDFYDEAVLAEIFPEDATAIDNCDGPVDVVFEDAIIGTCPTELRRTWIAVDCAGNVSEQLQRITCVSNNEVTDSSLCIFDRDPDNELEQDFRLLFTPDTRNQPFYKISSTQPGQTFYNVFYKGEEGDEVTLTVCIPYPYVTHGAVPIHAYDWVYLQECGAGVGLVPGNAFYSEKSYITLESYGDNPGFDMSACFMDITFTVPESGFAYLNIHLEHGLPGTGGYSQDIEQNAFDLDSGEVLVPNKWEHIFTVEGSVEDSDSIFNLNDFKGGPGVAGIVTDVDTGEPIPDAIIVLTGRRGRIQVTCEVDANGYYFIPHIHKGKPSVYELWMITPSGSYESRNVLMKMNDFCVEDFTVDEDE